MIYEDTILNIIRANPGATGYDIICELRRRSRTGLWFGENSLWTVLFGPSNGGMYVTLARLERRGSITSIWGIATPERGWNRPRHYYAA